MNLHAEVDNQRVNFAAPNDQSNSQGSDPIEEIQAADRVFSIDDAFKYSGGFGKFQWYYSVVLIVVFSMHGYLPYTLAYQLLMPPFFCKPADQPDSTPYECKHDAFYKHSKCDPNILFTPNMDTSESLYNWAYDMELFCTSSFEIGLFGSLYFVGFMLGSLTLLRLADIFGRRPIYFLGIVLHLASLTLAIFIESLLSRYLCIAALGVATAITVNCTFVYMLELVPANRQNLLGGFPHALDGLNIAFCTLYLT